MRETPNHPRLYADRTLKVLTYNIHRCLGTDGQYLPERIANVIARLHPDIVALQEVDVNRSRSDNLDQAHRIAHFLGMAYHFHPSFQVAGEQYGNAILSHLPMRLIKAGALPGSKHLEPRGALWVAVTWQGIELQVFNTHLGLLPAERHLQLQALMSPDWLGQLTCREPCILCGDLNAPPRSSLCQRLRTRLADTAAVACHRHLRGTFPSRFPLVRLDHIFVSPSLNVIRVEVSSNRLTRLASDHLPLLAELAV